MIAGIDTKTDLKFEIDTETTAYANVVGLMYLTMDEVMKPDWNLFLAIYKYSLWDKAMRVLANESVKD